MKLSCLSDSTKGIIAPILVKAEKLWGIFFTIWIDPQRQAGRSGHLGGFEYGLGQRQRSLYLPAGGRRVNAWTGQVYAGGQTVTVPAPLEQMPVFLKEGSGLMKLFQAPGSGEGS